jgi:hypothetical protein
MAPAAEATGPDAEPLTRNGPSPGGWTITQDTTAHSGGLWKMANSDDGFGPGTRLGTYDYNLNWIGT